MSLVVVFIFECINVMSATSSVVHLQSARFGIAVVKKEIKREE